MSRSLARPSLSNGSKTLSRVPRSAFHLGCLSKRASSTSPTSPSAENSTAKRADWSPIRTRLCGVSNDAARTTIRSPKVADGFSVNPHTFRHHSVASSRRFTSSSIISNSANVDGGSPSPLPRTRRVQSRLLRRLSYLLAFLAFSAICYETIPPARHLLIASIRCLRLLKAVSLSVLDYKWTFIDWYPASQYTPEERKRLARLDRHACHARSSARLYEALKLNGAIYVKLGQHIGSIQALPVE
jgi:aarF domain-containing kinase